MMPGRRAISFREESIELILPWNCEFQGGNPQKPHQRAGLKQAEVPLTERLRRYTAPLNGRLRDDGLPFDPTTRVPSEVSRGYLTDGIEIVKSMASDLRYARVLNMNQTTIAVGRR